MNWLKKRARIWLNIRDYTAEDKKALKESVKMFVTDSTRELKRMTDKFENMEKMVSVFFEVPCEYCRKAVVVHPYGGSYYILDKGHRVHAQCYDDYLMVKKRKENV